MSSVQKEDIWCKQMEVGQVATRLDRRHGGKCVRDDLAGDSHTRIPNSGPRKLIRRGVPSLGRGMMICDGSQSGGLGCACPDVS